MENIKEKLRKIKALAERGYEGERKAAQEMLDNLLKKYNLTLDDIRSGEIKTHWFFYVNQLDRKLLFQIYSKVTDCHAGIEYYNSKHRKRQIGFDITPLQAAEIKILQNIYRKAFREETEFLLRAFIQKHKITPSPSQDNNSDDIDIEELLRILSMVNNMKDVVIPRSMIERGKI